MSYLERLREQNPLTICITNEVVKNFSANGLLALGASPAMSQYQDDLEDLVPYASGLLVNIGTITGRREWNLYKDALDIAERNGVPTVLDPVAAGAGVFRKKVALDLIDNHHISLIRGNAGEVAALIGESVATKGADSSQVDNIGEIALKANQTLGIPVVVTGKIDAIAVDGQVRLVDNGSSLMPLVTGTGCLLGAVLAAFVKIGLETGDLLACLEEAVATYAIAGELAEKTVGASLPGSFQIAFLDALHQITPQDITNYKQVSDYA